jgi:hypothetical protein
MGLPRRLGAVVFLWVAGLASPEELDPMLIIEGSVSIDGLSEARAIEYLDVLEAGISAVAGRESADVTLVAPADARRALVDGGRRRFAGAPGASAPEPGRRRADVVGVVVSYRLVEPVTSSEGVVAQLATADPFDYTEAIDEAAASSGDPNATQVFALAAVTDVTAPITYFAPTPMPTPRPRGGVPEVTGSSSSSKRKGLRKSTLISLCVATFFICLTLVLIRLAKSDRLMEELREARKAETRVAVVDSGPEKVHPVAVPVSSDGSDAKDAGFARPAELSLGWRS